MRARYYNPGTGRFISRDSFTGKDVDPLSLNLYTYCQNNPLLYVDPSGMFCIMPPMSRDNLEFASTGTIKPPNSIVIYANYSDKHDTKVNKKQAKVIQKQYQKEYGGKCNIYAVNSAEEFTGVWNSLDDSHGIDAIQIISHGHYSKDSNGNVIGKLMFNDSSLYAAPNSSWNEEDRSIANINAKNVKNIYFSACNTANEDFTSNIAGAFFERNTNANTVSGWDGGVAFRFTQRGWTSIKSGNFKLKPINKDFPLGHGGTTFQTLMSQTGNTREPGLRELKRN